MCSFLVMNLYVYSFHIFVSHTEKVMDSEWVERAGKMEFAEQPVNTTCQQNVLREQPASTTCQQKSLQPFSDLWATPLSFVDSGNR